MIGLPPGASSAAATATSATSILTTPLADQPAATALALVLACVLGAVHLYGRLCKLAVFPRSGLLSAAGGAAVAYVFVHLLPEIEHARRIVERGEPWLMTFTERHVYLVALAGFVAFYGLERFAQNRGGPSEADCETEPGVFWVHVGSFAAYNALVGYLLVHREGSGVIELLAFFVAMGLHFLVNDHGLRELHRGAYRRSGRWLLATAVVGGAVIGAFVKLGPGVVWILFAFLAGAIVLNTIKEELLTERESRFWAFAAGAVGYASLLLLV